MIERFFLNAENKLDGRMLVVELHKGGCTMVVYHKDTTQPPPWSEWKRENTEHGIALFLELKGCEDPLELTRNVSRFAREHGVQLEELTPDQHLAFLKNEDKQADSSDRPTLCPEV